MCNILGIKPFSDIELKLLKEQMKLFIYFFKFEK